MKLLTCRDCAERKPVGRFVNYKSISGEQRCKVCAERAKDMSATKNMGKSRTTKDRFGGHPSKKHLEYEAFSVVAKATECEMCGEVPEGGNLCIDHCHKTNKIRGALCNRCNLAIGCLSDDRGNLAAARNYIEAYKYKLEQSK